MRPFQLLRGRGSAALTLLGSGFAVLLTGCATSAPRASFSRPMGTGAEVRTGDAAQVSVVAAPGVVLRDFEAKRIADEIDARVAAKERLNAPGPQSRSIEVDVVLTRYEKGSAVARWMLAGLGQIHIDADVTVLQLPQRQELGQFVVKKTFAWGGLYGAMTDMDTVEQGFAEGVADALTGQGKKAKT